MSHPVTVEDKRRIDAVQALRPKPFKKWSCPDAVYLRPTDTNSVLRIALHFNFNRKDRAIQPPGACDLDLEEVADDGPHPFKSGDQFSRWPRRVLVRRITTEGVS